MPRGGWSSDVLHVLARSLGFCLQGLGTPPSSGASPPEAGELWAFPFLTLLHVISSLITGPMESIFGHVSGLEAAP